MSLQRPQYCWDVGRSGLKCTCSEPPPKFSVSLPPIPPKPTSKFPSIISGTASSSRPSSNLPTTFTKNIDTVTGNLPDAKIFGLIIGLVIILLILFIFLICYFCKRRRDTKTVNNGDEAVVSPGRGRLKLSPSNCSQKPLLRVSGVDFIVNPQQTNGEPMANDNKLDVPVVGANTSFTGGDLVIPMIDEIDNEQEEEEEEDDDAVINRIMFNESSC